MNLDQMLNNGFQFEIKRVPYGEDETRKSVRLTSPSGHVSTGLGKTTKDAVIIALGHMVLRVEGYLIDTQTRFDRAEDMLHRQGHVANLLDTDEVERMRKRYKPSILEEEKP